MAKSVHLSTSKHTIVSVCLLKNVTVICGLYIEWWYTFCVESKRADLRRAPLQVITCNLVCTVKVTIPVSFVSRCFSPFVTYNFLPLSLLPPSLSFTPVSSPSFGLLPVLKACALSKKKKKNLKRKKKKSFLWYKCWCHYNLWRRNNFVQSTLWCMTLYCVSSQTVSAVVSFFSFRAYWSCTWTAWKLGWMKLTVDKPADCWSSPTSMTTSRGVLVFILWPCAVQRNQARAVCKVCHMHASC